MKSTNDAIARWLAPSSQFHQHLLRQCEIRVQDGRLTVDCPKEVLERILTHSEDLEAPSELLGVQEIHLLAGGSLLYKIPVGKPQGVHLDCFDLDINRVDPVAIIRMADHVGVQCSQGIWQSSGAQRDQWLGQDMSQYHFPKELKRLVQALEQHKLIWGFEYQAYSFQMEPMQLVVNAHLFERGGVAYRCVETTYCLRA